MEVKKFIECMKILSMAYNTKFSDEQIMLWYGFFKEYDYEVFKRAVSNICKESKFIPNVAILKEYCEEAPKSLNNDVIEFMDKQGYFKDTVEKDKAMLFVCENIIPAWFRDDFDNYKYKLSSQKKLGSQAMLES